MPKRQILLHSGLALLTAVLLLLIFPKFDLRWLAPVALTPLLVVLARTPHPGQRFIFGWGAGIVYWFGLCTWIQFVLDIHGGMGSFGAWGAFLLFCLLKALHLAVFSWLAGPLLSRPYALPAVGALWIGLERTHGTFGFAWLALGNAGIDMSVPLRLAPVVGVYGLSFVFCVLSAAVACIILRKPRVWLTPLLLLPGIYLLPPIPQQIPANDRAVLVQPNIDPETEWTNESQRITQNQLSIISQALPGKLILWPELPAPLYFDNNPLFHDQAVKIAQRHGHFVFMTVTFNAQQQPLNTVITLGPDGREVGRYSQLYLVPFGEFTPPLFAWVNRITHESGDFVPGDAVKVLPVGEHHFGSFICYESAFPHLVRQFSKAGADVLLNLSNDGYFGHSEARQQHLLLVRMRAVENRRFIIRATNDGITAVLDPAGRVIKRLPPYQQLGAFVSYAGISQTTFYAEHGDWFAWSCLFIGVALSARNLWPASRESQSAASGLSSGQQQPRVEQGTASPSAGQSEKLQTPQSGS